MASSGMTAGSSLTLSVVRRAGASHSRAEAKRAVPNVGPRGGGGKPAKETLMIRIRAFLQNSTGARRGQSRFHLPGLDGQVDAERFRLIGAESENESEEGSRCTTAGQGSGIRLSKERSEACALKNRKQEADNKSAPGVGRHTRQKVGLHEDFPSAMNGLGRPTGIGGCFDCQRRYRN